MKIAILRLSALGDIVQTSIALQFIKKHYKDAKIDWICEERFCGILENHELINKVIKLNLKDREFIKSLKTLKEVKKNNYDLVIDFQGLIKSALVARYLSKKTVGFDKLSIRESFASNFYAEKINISYKDNVIIRYLTLASKALNFKFSKDEILSKKPCFAKDKTVLNLDKNMKNILVVVGSSVKTKIYDKNLQIKLINNLNNSGYEVYLSYTQGEKELGDFILAKTNAKKLPNFQLDKLPSAISAFDLVIGPDSGPTHIAWAMNVKSITIFGYTPHFRNAFTTKENLVIHSGKEIDPLNLNKNDFCINKINPNDIANLAIGLLNG